MNSGLNLDEGPEAQPSPAASPADAEGPKPTEPPQDAGAGSKVAASEAPLLDLPSPPLPLPSPDERPSSILSEGDLIGVLDAPAVTQYVMQTGQTQTLLNNGLQAMFF